MKMKKVPRVRCHEQVALGLWSCELHNPLSLPPPPLSLSLIFSGFLVTEEASLVLSNSPLFSSCWSAMDELGQTEGWGGS